MPALDLGGIFASADIITAPFDAKYAVLIRQMSELGTRAESASGGFSSLDRGLVGVGASADKASVGLDRVAKTTTTSASAEQKATAAATQHARAVAEVSAAMARAEGTSTSQQAATLRQVAADQRLTAASAEAGSAEAKQAAETARLASAQAGAVSATARLAAAQDASAASSSRFGTAMAGGLKTAGELGLVVGGFEAIKKAIDITKEANDFQRSMVQVQTNADVSAAEVNKASGALLSMAGPVAAAPAELATAWYHAKSVGLDYAKSLDTTRIAAEGARVGHADLEETMNALTSTVASNIPGVKNMSSAMGQLIAIVGSGDMKLSDLNEALGSGILTVVKGYGLSLTDVGAALATFGDNNIRGANAATMLRMSVQAMAVPMKGGYAELDKLGLSATKLRDDMQSGGLNKAILDLKSHLDAAGVSSTEVGAVLTEVFGKRAGPGIAVLVSQVDRLQSKFEILRDSGATFGEKWKATTETASFALDSLGHRIEAAGITLTAKLGPSIASAATWLGTDVPHAVAQAQAALGPLEHEVGGALVIAWHLLAAVIGAAASALGTIGHLAASNSGALTDLATAALVTWAAFKGVTLAVAGLKALDGALLATRIRLLALADGFTAVAAGEKVMSAGAFVGILGAIGVAAYAAGKGISSVTEANNSFAHVMDSSAASTKSFTDALNESNGAMTTQVARTVGMQLQSDGLAAKAKAAGISLSQLTAGVTGGTKALADLWATWEKQGKPSGDTLTALGLLSAQYSGAASGAKDLATVTKASTAATQAQSKAAAEAVQQQQELAAALATLPPAYNEATQTGTAFLDAVTTFSKSAGTAADRATLIGAALRNNAGDALNFAANINAAATSVHQLGADAKSNASQIGKSGESVRTYIRSLVDLSNGSIDFHKVAAGPLINDLQSIQTSAINAAQATYQHNKAIEGGKAAADDAIAGYKGVEDSLVSQLHSMGLSTGAAQKLTDKYLGVPSHVKTLIEQAGADPVVTILNKIGQLLANLTGQTWDAKVDANTNPLQTKIKAAQGYVDRLKQNRVPGIQVGTAEYYRQLAAAQARLNGLQDKTVHLSIITTTSTGFSTKGSSGAKTSGNASGGGLPEGVSAVGEEGPELAIKNGPHVDILSNAQSKAYLAATGMRAPGFAGGTGASSASLTQLAVAAVQAIIAAATSPTAVKAETSASLGGDLAASTAAAVAKEKAAEAAAASYAKLEAEATKLSAAEKAAASAASNHAQQLSNAAHAAHEAAANMATGTKADAAAKTAAEAHARALDDEARAARQAAQTTTAASASRVAALKSEATEAAATAAKAKTAATAAKTAAKTAADAVASIAKSLVSSIQSSADTLKSTITDFKSSISSDITGGDSLSSLWQALTGTDANGNPLNASLAGLQTNLDNILARAQSFSSDLNKLVNEGANQNLITQLSGMGSQAGDALAQQLLAAGPSAITALQSTMTSIQNLAGNEADQLAQSFYGPGVTAMDKFIAGLEKEFPALKKALDPIMTEINAVLTAEGGPVTVTAKSPTGGGTAVPGFASGVTDFAGGLAYVHRDELLVNLPNRTSVIPASKTPLQAGMDSSAVVNELRALRSDVNGLATSIGHEVTTSGAYLYDRAGSAQADRLARIVRKN